MAAKIVYYGPGLCGKTSNLSYIYAKTTPNSRGEMVSLETESDRTLFFDLLPIEVGTIGGFKTRLQLYTVPGQVFYNTTRKLVLKGVDGLVFVADSQRPMREANTESFTSLVENLEDLGLEMSDLPLVLQYNKRDLKNILTVDELNSDLNPSSRYPYFEASAINGDGVFETLKEITKLTLKKLRRRMASSQPGAVAPPSQPVRPAMSSPRPESISAAALARAAEEGVVSDAAPDPVPPPPTTPTTVAPPVPATPSSSAPVSDVFSTPSDPVDEAPDDGPLDGPVEFPPIEVTAPELEDNAGHDASEELELADDGWSGETVEADAGAGWQGKETEVSELAGTTEPERETDPAEQIDFEQQPTVESAAQPPPMKRVHVSNQLDILAELESLRTGSLSGGSTGRRRSSTPDLDIDSLISGAVGGARELRRRVEDELDANVFDHMHGLELAIRVKNADGDTIHSLKPTVLEVKGAGELSKLKIRFSVDLKSNR
jgi:signal recognition particle receptor subunit beta